MRQNTRAAVVIAAMVMASGTAVSLAGSAGALEVAAGKGGSTLRLDGRAVRSTAARIADQRLITFQGSGTVVAAWTERQGASEAEYFALSYDGGQTFVQVMATPGLVRLRYAEFDPTLGEPPVPPELAADGSNELFLVQFVSTPLEEMRAEIRAAGGTVSRFLTENTHIIRMGAQTRARVEAMPFVRWVGAYHPAYRLEEATREAMVAGERMGAVRYSVECMEAGPEQQGALIALVQQMGGQIHTTTPDQYRFEATMDRDQLLTVLRRNEVSFIDPWGGPGGPDMDQIRQYGGAVPILSTAGFLGQGVRGEIFDTGSIAAHQQWNGQAPLIHNANNTDSHGVACYGVHFATGTGNAQATGLLPMREQGVFCYYNATSQFAGGPSRLTLNTEAVDPAGPYRSCYQTSSVGNSQITTYSTISAEVDDYLFKVDYLSCQSQSNLGTRSSRPQAWAKNIVSVGGLDLKETLNYDDDIKASGASIGPAPDLRVKPDLSHSYGNIFTTYSTSTTGYGQFGGTSGATPITAAHFGLLMQMWHEEVFDGFGGGSSVFADRPKSTTAKALMINGAYRYPINQTSTGQSFTNSMYRAYVGWGRADLGKLYNGAGKIFVVNADDPLTNAQSAVYQLTVLPDEPELRATMIYPDPMPAVGAGQQRVNDLSLKVTSPTGTVYWGNSGMVPTAISGAGQQVGAHVTTPGGTANTYDTVENVFLVNPEAGVWTVEVIATQVVQDGHTATPAVDAVYSLVVSNVQLVPPPLTMALATPIPGLVAPGDPIQVDVTVVPGAQNVVPGSPSVWYRAAASGDFVSSPLQSLGNDLYRAVLPEQVCDTTPQLYFTAAGDGGAAISLPGGAPTAFFSTLVGTMSTTVLMTTSFESGLPAGWSTTGLWNIGSSCPTGGTCDGPSWAHYGQPATCTYNTGAATSGLLSTPAIALPALPPDGSITLTYCSAKITENNAAYDKGTVLVNGVLVDTAAESSAFQTRTVDLTSYAGETVTLQWKFDSVDSINNNFRGWHVDNIKLTVVGATCDDTGPAPCYANCDGSIGEPVLNVADFTCFLQRFAAAESYANCDESTSPPLLNVADFTCFLQKFAAGCP